MRTLLAVLAISAGLASLSGCTSNPNARDQGDGRPGQCLRSRRIQQCERLLERPPLIISRPGSRILRLPGLTLASSATSCGNGLVF